MVPDVQENTAPKTANTSVLRSVIGRLLWLPGLIPHISKSRESKVTQDAELKLYAEMFPSGFLHYGFFPDPDIEARNISFGDVDQAQLDYAQNLIDLITDTKNPVLDVGCGTGGISAMLIKQGIPAIALTPDKYQVAYIKQNRPEIQVLENRFEDFDDQPFQGKFGTVLNSESLQYLDLEISLPKIRRLLMPGGKWVICDYFCLSDEKSSGHNWKIFTDALEKHGFRIIHEQDITPNILPTLKFASLLGQRFILPTIRFAEGKLRVKAPGIYYILESLFEKLQLKSDRALHDVDPEAFAKRKRYVTLVIEPVD